jgi:hypothetical protein
MKKALIVGALISLQVTACTIAQTENNYTLTGDNNTITGTDTINTEKSTDVDAGAAASQNGSAAVTK